MLEEDLQGWALKELKAQPDAPSPTLALLDAIEGMLGVLHRHPDAVLDRFREGPGSPSWKACQELFSQILRNGIIAGDFRRDLDTQVMGLSLTAMVYGNVAHDRLMQTSSDTETLATELYRSLLAGLAAPPLPLKKPDSPV
ncbi:hypothetical protein D3C72_176930 [compost metagenome]